MKKTVFVLLGLSFALLMPLRSDSFTVTGGGQTGVRQATYNSCTARNGACCNEIADYQNCLLSRATRTVKVNNQNMQVLDNNAWGGAMNSCSSNQARYEQCVATAKGGSQGQIPHQTTTKYPTQTEGGGIRVVSATYGKNCGASYSNKTAHLASSCNGKAVCQYTINSRIIGDPKKGCEKDYEAEWRCPGSWKTYKETVGKEAGNGDKSVTLSCQ